jgi:error-prone DNA polymerase
MTIEDETGIANVVVWPSLLERYRREVMGARLAVVEGRVQRSPEGIVHVVAERLIDRTIDLQTLAQAEMPTPLARADEVRRPVPDGRAAGGHGHAHPRNVRVVPKSRDFR